MTCDGHAIFDGGVQIALVVNRRILAHKGAMSGFPVSTCAGRR